MDPRRRGTFGEAELPALLRVNDLSVSIHRTRPTPVGDPTLHAGPLGSAKPLAQRPNPREGGRLALVPAEPATRGSQQETCAQAKPGLGVS